ncbi:MAG TPA: glycosyltransferase 87 family protein [Ktedonobacterales bacterium]|nr:glycosyltransferase 87 family protein [Ktedonobacterales bacterium]
MRWPLEAVDETDAARMTRRKWLHFALELLLVIAVLVATRVMSNQVWKLPDGDVKEYRDYALSFWTSAPYFHQLPVEYPPLAIIPFTFAVLPGWWDYHVVFAVWMGLLVLLGYLGFLVYANRRRAIIYLVYLAVGSAAVVLSRFDIVPALITLVALWLAERRRFGYAYVLIAAGILTKLYPGFLLPVVAIEHWRVATARAIAEGRDTLKGATTWWRGSPRQIARQFLARPATKRVAQGVALCLGLTVLGFACAMALSPAGALSGFGYASKRPLQVESTPASILWIGSLFGIPAAPNYSFVSLNYVGALDGVLKPLSAVALVGGCLWVYWRQTRGRLTVGQAFLACLCAVLVTNKIFSPQYLIWVLPVVAYIEGFDTLWLVICVLTTLDYPIIYQMRHPIWTVTFSWQFMPVLALRNVLLLWATIRAILRTRASAPRTAQALPAVTAPPVMPSEPEPSRGGEPALAGQAER